MTDDDYIIMNIIMKIYSLETFVYRTVNYASRDRDESKIKNLGPYAYLLSKIL